MKLCMVGHVVTRRKKKKNTTLQHYGVPSEMVIFPRENHNLTRTGEPKHLVESLNWQVYWFERYLNGNAASKPPDAP